MIHATSTFIDHFSKVASADRPEISSVLSYRFQECVGCLGFPEQVSINIGIRNLKMVLIKEVLLDVGTNYYNVFELYMNLLIFLFLKT